MKPHDVSSLEHVGFDEGGRVRILIVLDGPWMGHVTGGITRTVVNMISQPPAGCVFTVWSWSGEDRLERTGDASGFRGRISFLWRILTATGMKEADVVYFNGVFSVALLAGLLGRRLFWRRRPRLVVAPRGHLMAPALKQSWLRKRLFLLLLKGLTGGISLRWHVTSELERAALREVFGGRDECLMVPNLPPPALRDRQVIPASKRSGEARLIFVGDLIPHKGADLLLRALVGIDGRVHLDIVGAMGDRSFALEVKELAQELSRSSSKSTTFHGFLPSEETFELIEGAHFLVLPSRSENHGHVVVEALAMSRPVLISDRTPWRDIPGAGAGFIAPGEDLDSWRQALTEILAMNQDVYGTYSRNARTFFDRYLNEFPWERYSGLFTPLGAQPTDA